MKSNKHDVDAYVGQRVRQRRIELKVTQEEVASQLGLSFQQIQKYEKGSNRIAAGRLFKLAKILDVPITYFFDGAHEKEQTGTESPPAMTAIKDLIEDPEVANLARKFVQIQCRETRNAIVTIVGVVAQPVDREND